MAVDKSMPRFSGTNIPRPVPDPNQGKLNFDGRGRKPNLAPSKPVPTKPVPTQQTLNLDNKVKPKNTIPKVDKKGNPRTTFPKVAVDDMGNKVKPTDYKKLAKFGKAAWKASKIPRALTPIGLGTMVLEEALFPTVYDAEETKGVLSEEQSELDADSLKALTAAQDKVELLTEVNASPELLAQAKIELTKLKSATDPQQSITEWEDDVKNDLANNQAIIDAHVRNLSFDPEALRRALKPALEQRDALEAKLSDATSWRKDISASAAVDKDPDSVALMNMAQGMDPTKLMPQLGTEDRNTVQEEGDSALKAFFDGSVDTVKGAMALAGKGLGSLWEDTAIKNALVYYMGARLMGYSGSGSGMAAGQVLIQGWKNQAAADIVTTKAENKAAANSAVDQTKSVQLWDKSSKRIISGYSSKDGKSFYQITDDGLNKDEDGNPIAINPVTSGLVTYKSGTHQTFDEINKSILDSTNKNTNDFLKALNSNTSYDAEDLEALNQTFGNGRAARDVLEVVTREMQEAGVDYDNAAFTAMFQNMLTSTMEKQANGLRKGDYGEETASMVGEWREMQLKNSLTGEGNIPDFIYGKATKWGDNGVAEYEKGFDASGHAKGVLETKINSLRNYWVKSAVTNGATKQDANEKITTTRVVQELGRLFQDTVMLDPIARVYWTDQAGDRSNAFMSWMQSNDTSTINHEHQYLGLNSPEVRGIAVNIDFDSKF